MAPLQTQELSLFDFSGRTKLRIAGTDRVRFLNGQITNDARKATDSAAIEACILNAKGKIDAHVFISTGPDCFFIDADPELREALLARLERYVIADDVQIEDLSEGLSIFHVMGTTEPTLGEKCRIVSTRRFIELGWDIWLDSVRHDPMLQELSERFRLVDSAATELFRIEQGIPRWGHDLNGEIIPIEANLEARAVDYEKGCYIGQEVISRIKMSGQTNKRLCGLVASSETRLLAGMELFRSVEHDTKAGWITSAARSERLGKAIALGYVKRGFNSTGTKLCAIVPDDPDASRLQVEIVPLPFV